MNIQKIAKNKGLALRNSKGFTLIEILVVIAIIAILAAIVIVAINPAKRFKDARNSQRQANVESILSAIQQNMVDNKGIFTCSAGTIPTTVTTMRSSGGYDIAPCLSDYLAVMPVDPQSPGAWTSVTNYNTGYNIQSIGSSGQVTIAAPNAEGVTISVTR